MEHMEHMENMEPIEAEGTNGQYYPVELDDHGKPTKIVGLPPGEDKRDFVISLATNGQKKTIGTKYVAEKHSPREAEEEDQWGVHGRGPA